MAHKIVLKGSKTASSELVSPGETSHTSEVWSLVNTALTKDSALSDRATCKVQQITSKLGLTEAQAMA